MEKSIESIWSEGFMKADSLKAPKVIDLYNRKSELVVDRLLRTMKLDLYSIIPVGIGMGIWIYFENNLLLAILTTIALTVTFGLSLWQYRKFKKIDTSSDSYQYLLTFYSTLKIVLNFFTKFFALAYPVVALPIYYTMVQQDDWMQSLMNNPLPKLILYGWIAFVVVGLSGVIGYRLVVYLVYGRMINKLKEIIQDMEELKQIES